MPVPEEHGTLGDDGEVCGDGGHKYCPVPTRLAAFVVWLLVEGNLG